MARFKAISRGVLAQVARLQGSSLRNSTENREESSENPADLVQDCPLFMERLNP
jgi:hypothetical protein